MDRSCVNRLKNLMIFLNFLCWAIHSKFASLVTTFWPIYPANTLVVTGTIVTCVCYLGVLGAMKENRCLLVSFFILLFILMLIELAMACVFLVYSRVIDTYFEKDLTQSLAVYRQSGPGENQTIKEDFDAVQHLFRCCGVRGEADWMGKVPISCCVQDPCTSPIKIYWQEVTHSQTDFKKSQCHFLLHDTYTLTIDLGCRLDYFGTLMKILRMKSLYVKHRLFNLNPKWHIM
ncbi:leukocyte surface antigen CD53-like isoform X2 [Hippocampus comes]|uniref:leukocyte surface antigen CD53-like isoform X2 n=1 Tax=Hippocampus comes TaxID=109280 RepID=UPI00094F33E8|nr:PREDICTED: leukocyte surface antigen CD53-like isoform X2 [Hippocampus comes]